MLPSPFTNDNPGMGDYMKQFDVEITQVNSYNIKIGDKVHHGFHKTGEWEGMVKFQGPAGELVVFSKEASFVNFFDNVFNTNKSEGEKKSFTVARITPDLVPLPSEEETSKGSKAAEV